MLAWLLLNMSLVMLAWLLLYLSIACAKPYEITLPPPPHPLHRYVDLGIKYALRDLPPYVVDESSEILLARQLRSKCLLLENKYAEAEFEAEICIRAIRRGMPTHMAATALYVQAEALYLQCQVCDQC